MENPLSIQIHNRQRFERGEPGEWLKLPATADQLHAAMRSVGITGDNPEDFFVGGIESPIEAVRRLPFEQVQSATIDEFNYLAAQLERLTPPDLAALHAAGEVMDYWNDVHHLTEYVHNTDYFVYIPGVTNHAELGEHYLYKSEMVQMPEGWKAAVDVERLGRLAAEQENGIFSDHGYIVDSGDKWEPVNEIPQEYHIMSYPQPELTTEEIADLAGERERALRDIGDEQLEPPTPFDIDGDRDTDYDAAPAVAVAPPAVTPQPVKPIALESQNPTEKLKEITDKLEQGIAGIFDSEQYADYLKTLSKFHDYSLNNTILIAMQKPDASHVAGFNAWKNDFERSVRKGEKGIKIIAPSPYKVKVQQEKTDPATGQPVIGVDGKPVIEETERKIPAYKVVSVFDVSQTEGKELPTLGADIISGDVEQYQDFFAALEKASPAPIAFEPMRDDVNGYYHHVDKRIAIAEGMSELQTLKTTIHEIAHARLHDIDKNKEQEQQPRPDKRTREVEAESIAYTVCQHYGLDTSDYSFGYVAGWSAGRELTELKASLETIRATAAEIIGEIDGHFAELEQGRERTAEQQPGHEEWSEPATAENSPDNPGVPSDDVDAYLPQQPEQSPQAADVEPPTDAPETAVKYYSINEQGARRAKEANSYYDYKPGSATAEYRQAVDKAAELANWQKSRVDPMYHDKIDGLLDTYARKLADNMNSRFSIDARVPSIMIAGPSNFPVRQKEKQNAARDSNMRDWQDVQGLLDKIRSTGMGGISADDPAAVKKLQEKLSSLEQAQDTMKAVNAYYRKHKTLDGCPNLTTEQIARLKADMVKGWHLEGKPYASYSLTNNNAEIRRIKNRIEELTRRSEAVYVGWQFDGGRVEPNTQDNRLQIFFDGKPDESTRTELKSNGFRWAPSAGAWQRQLNNNAFYACNYIKSIQPDNGEKPTDLQRKARREAAAPIQQGGQDTRAQERAEPQQGDTFTIFQLKDGSDTRYYRFEPFDRLQAAGLDVDPGNYNLVYTGQLAAGDTLESIFERFNIDHPADFTGHSLSVSDVVTLNRRGEETAHYVDVAGFKDVPPFLQQQAQFHDMQQTAAEPDSFLTGERIDTPRGRFFLTDMTAEQMKATGYGYHHSSDDGKYHIMGNGTRAFAIINPLRTAEMSTEQNYNMIDGIPNNRPSVSELEAKAEAGEQINLSDLAAAIKAEKGASSRDEDKKPSIRAQLKEAREQQRREKPPQQQTRDKSPGLEV